MLFAPKFHLDIHHDIVEGCPGSASMTSMVCLSGGRPGYYRRSRLYLATPEDRSCWNTIFDGTVCLSIHQSDRPGVHGDMPWPRQIVCCGPQIGEETVIEIIHFTHLDTSG